MLLHSKKRSTSRVPYYIVPEIHFAGEIPANESIFSGHNPSFSHIQKALTLR